MKKFIEIPDLICLCHKLNGFSIEFQELQYPRREDLIPIDSIYFPLFILNREEKNFVYFSIKQFIDLLTEVQEELKFVWLLFIGFFSLSKLKINKKCRNKYK